MAIQQPGDSAGECPFGVGLRPSVKVRYPTWGESSDVIMLGQFKRIINLDTKEVAEAVPAARQGRKTTCLRACRTEGSVSPILR